MVYDLAVIGGGPGGYNAAERAAHAGMKVVLFEKAALGGVCLNEGCIPTKAMLYSAKLYDGAKAGEKYGLQATGLVLDHATVLARKKKVVRTLVAGVKAALKNVEVEVVMEAATLAGKGGEGFAITAESGTYTAGRVLVAAGSQSAVPPVEGLAQGLESGWVMTSREALECEEVPQSLVVIGGGVIGLELASYYGSAGSQVTVVEMLPQVAGDAADAELATVLQKNYEKKGICFHLGARVLAVKDGSVHFQEADGDVTSLSTDKVLLATGRRPSAVGLGLEAVGAELNGGAVVTGPQLQTNVPGLYAVGDVNGRSMLAHTAYREGEVAVNHMLGVADVMDYAAIPGVIYTNPEYAGVGETEKSAAEKGLDVQVIKLPMRFSGRYIAENEGGDGLFKMVVDKHSRTILGAQALGSYASEFIVAVGSFVAQKTPLEEVKKIVFPHPTVGEIVREAVFAADIQE